MDGLMLEKLAERVKQDFPIFQQTVNGHPLVYLDSAATSQKPRAVLHAMQEFYGRYNSNVHRSVHKLSEEATDAYEQARKTIARFIGAHHREIIFTKNATEALNLAANCLKNQLQKNDGVLFTEMEHHSNIVPWQMVSAEKGAKTSAVKITEEGFLDHENLEEEIAENPKIFSFAHVSNVLGTINDVENLCKKASDCGAVSVIDAAQSVPHMPVDVKKIGCDFLAFSGHKMLGPTGIGVLYARKELLEQLPPFLGGGDMIKEVHIDSFIPADVPAKFEAGTPPIAESIGLAEAVRYLEKIGMESI
ncbi:MAG: aminotransferase class V-fold PLP-dependent enzyme, partial [Candidatus Aenigmarchaeota archaeon]|nr:aminotransferase class V-fold PLP-dependent enzyme [Candidatus Aenigmarchaeota archaeon]